MTVLYHETFRSGVTAHHASISRTACSYPLPVASDLTKYPRAFICNSLLEMSKAPDSLCPSLRVNRLSQSTEPSSDHMVTARISIPISFALQALSHIFLTHRICSSGPALRCTSVIAMGRPYLSHASHNSR